MCEQRLAFWASLVNSFLSSSVTTLLAKVLVILVKDSCISGLGNWAFALRYHHEALPEHQRGKNDAAQIQHLSQDNSFFLLCRGFAPA